jgi:hypothetical protein
MTTDVAVIVLAITVTVLAITQIILTIRVSRLSALLEYRTAPFCPHGFRDWDACPVCSH